jgi:two-component system sensor histidine kinase/response regulator
MATATCPASASACPPEFSPAGTTRTPAADADYGSTHPFPEQVSALRRVTDQLRGRKVLVVDDDRVNRRILGCILETAGYAVSEASSGDEALARYTEIRPHLLLLDVEMPGIDGFATCRTLKAAHGAACAPIIFITARNSPEDVAEGLEAGGADYLPKPFRPREVVARIKAHLHNQFLADQQKQLVAQLSAANAAKNKFVGMAAHDLRNPLASIRGLAEFLRDGNLAADQRELVELIHGASQSMLDLVNELLDVATIEAGELKLDPQPCNLADLLRSCAFLQNIQAAKKNSRITLPEDDGAPTALLDVAKMRQVVDNLLSNAIKYSPPGSEIAVVYRSGPGSAGFAVRDQGPGIPDNERDKLFRDFGRLSAKPTGGESSTGLGLAICRKIVEAHRGVIAAENLPAGGCEFSVVLPALG